MLHPFKPSSIPAATRRIRSSVSHCRRSNFMHNSSLYSLASSTRSLHPISAVEAIIRRPSEKERISRIALYFAETSQNLASAHSSQRDPETQAAQTRNIKRENLIDLGASDFQQPSGHLNGSQNSIETSIASQRQAGFHPKQSPCHAIPRSDIVFETTIEVEMPEGHVGSRNRPQGQQSTAGPANRRKVAGSRCASNHTLPQNRPHKNDEIGAAPAPPSQIAKSQ